MAPWKESKQRVCHRTTPPSVISSGLHSAVFAATVVLVCCQGRASALEATGDAPLASSQAASLPRPKCSTSKLLSGKQPADESQHVTFLGKVADIEVCAMLCCEMASCDLAWLERGLRCSAVQCTDTHSCRLAEERTSSVALIERTPAGQLAATKQAGSDGVGGAGLSSTVVTQQATNSNDSNVIQKSAIPEMVGASDTHQASGSFVMISSRGTNSKVGYAGQDSSLNEDNEKQKGNSVTEKIQTLSDHLKKTDEKDTMALEESDPQAQLKVEETNWIPCSSP